MKRLFVCEWCGRVFENKYEAEKCEISHYIPLNVTPVAYAEGEEIPEIVKVDFGVKEATYRRINRGEKP